MKREVRAAFERVGKAVKSARNGLREETEIGSRVKRCVAIRAQNKKCGRINNGGRGDRARRRHAGLFDFDPFGPLPTPGPAQSCRLERATIAEVRGYAVGGLELGDPPEDVARTQVQTAPE